MGLLKRASSEEEVLAKILKLQLSMATALKVGSESSKRDWCKVCTLEHKLQDKSGGELVATDDEFVEAMCEKRERLVEINGRSITETTFYFRKRNVPGWLHSRRLFWDTAVGRHLH